MAQVSTNIYVVADPYETGGTFDLLLSDPSDAAIANEVALVASYRTGCTLTELVHYQTAEGAGSGDGQR